MFSNSDKCSDNLLSFFNSLPQIAMLLTKDMQVKHINKKGQEWLTDIGLNLVDTEEERYYLNLLQDIGSNAEQIKLLEKKIKNLYKNSEEEFEEEIILEKPEKKSCYSINASKFKEFIIILKEDITEFKKSRERYQRIIESADAVLWELNLKEEEFEYISPQAEDLFGYPLEKWNEVDFWQRNIHPEDKKRVEEERHNIIHSEKDSTIEYRFLTNDGEVIWLRDSVKMKIEAGEPVAIIGVSADITDEKREKKKLETIFKASKNVSFVITEATKEREEALIKEFSPGAEKIFGYKREEVLNKPVSILHSRKDVEKFAEIHNQLAEGQIWEDKVELIRKDGQRFPALFTVYPFTNEGEVERTLGVSIDITELEETRKELEKTKNQLIAILESIQDGISVVNPDLSIRYTNNTMEDWYAENLPLEGQKCYQAYHNRHEPCPVCPTLRSMESGEVEREVVTGLEGSDIAYLELFSYPMKEKDTGEITGVVEFVRDITERKEREEKLKKAMEEAKAANKAKSEFLANMSHEIRTPLNAVIGFSEILKDELDKNEHQEYLSTIITASDSLLSLINDILDMSKIEAKMLELKEEYFNPNDLLAEMKDILTYKAEEKGIDLFFQTVQEDLKIKFDQNKLKQILINLIGNAIKFTNKGYIKVEPKINITKENKLELEIIIEDTGIGITEEYQNQIFTPFTQQDGESTREYGGTGLGLAITKKLTELLGGNISLTSQPGQGSKFKLEFKDIDFIFSEDKGKLSNEMINIKFAPANILIVDDMKYNRKYIKDQLHKLGLKVFTGEDGQKALEILKEENIALILLDLKMPVMDGYETLKEMKKAGYQIPTIAFTAAATIEEKEKAKSAGFNGFMTKPIKKSNLTEKLASFLEYEKVTKGTDESSEEKAAEVDISEKAAKELADKFLADSKSISQVVVLDETEKFIARLKNFAEEKDLEIIMDYANKLEEALDKMDLVEIKEILADFIDLIESSLK